MKKNDERDAENINIGDIEVDLDQKGGVGGLNEDVDENIEGDDEDDETSQYKLETGSLSGRQLMQ